MQISGKPRIFVTAGNININSFKGICYAAWKVLGEITAIHIFDSKESADEAEKKQRNSIIRKIFGPIDICSSEITEQNIQVIIPERVSAMINEFNLENVIIDLSNGQKITASVLYAIATITRIPNIFVLDAKVKLSPDIELEKLNYPQDWDYILVEPLQGLQNISRSSYVELIYYRDQIAIITSELLKQNHSFGYDTKGVLTQVLIEYFSIGDNELLDQELIEKCINGLGKLCETIAYYWHSTCKTYGILTTEASNFNTRIEQIIKAWNGFREDVKNGILIHDDSPKSRMVYLNLNTDSFLKPMKFYRNIASHPNKYYRFEKSDAKLCLDMTLLMLGKLTESGIFLKEPHNG